MSRALGFCLLLAGLGFGCAAPTPNLEAQTLALAQSLTDLSDAVVRGVVVRTEVHPTGPGGTPGLHTKVVLEVDEALVGPPRTTTSFWVQGGELNGRRRVVTGQASYHTGESVLVFLYTSKNGTAWPTEMGRGKWQLLDAARARPSTGNYPALALPSLRTALKGPR